MQCHFQRRQASIIWLLAKVNFPNKQIAKLKTLCFCTAYALVNWSYVEVSLPYSPYVSP